LATAAILTPADNVTQVPSVYLLAGNGAFGFSGDGMALLAQLGYVSGSAVDNSGVIYLAQPADLATPPATTANSYLRKMVWTNFNPCPGTVASSLSCSGLDCVIAPSNLRPSLPIYQPGLVPLPNPW
jgi:hypothetical protein